MANARVDPGGQGKGKQGKTSTSNPFGGGGAPPPPPPSGSKATGERAVFTKFINAHPALRSYANDIWAWANHYGGITPTQLAAVIWEESKGDPNAKSNKGALGIAQIYDNTASATNAAGVPFFRANHVITTKDKLTPAFAIQYAAWRLSGVASTQGGSIDDIWKAGYNPNYRPGVDGPKNPISQWLPKNYVGTGAVTIDQGASKSVDTSAVEQGLKDPWVVAVKDAQGNLTKLKKVFGATAPKGTVVYDGALMTLSGWNHLARSLEQYFVSYTGGRPSAAMLYKYVTKGWSPYSLTVALAKSKKFVGSPIWKANAPAYEAAAKDLLPQGQKPPKQLITSAIVNNWSSSTFQAVLRKGPGYIGSNEFTSNVSALQNVHQSIMGAPDPSALTGIKEAALAGWDANQYASWLRAQPQYQQSPEYQTKTLTFLTQLGLITGQNPIAVKGTSPLPNDNLYAGPQLPQDSRITAKPKLSNPEDTVVTYGQ